jgi:putative Mg2+ transporter-C (MgtC) family protein
VITLAVHVSNGEQFHVYLWVLLALALGGVVGLEREYRGHEAGIRTTALVCAGAAVFSQVSESFGDSRVAAGVVQGVGFLGAGLVFQRGNDIKGVTTAATIWVMAGVGLVVGEQLWLSGILLSATVLFALELAPLSDWVLAQGRARRKRAHHPEPGEAGDSRGAPPGQE